MTLTISVKDDERTLGIDVDVPPSAWKLPTVEFVRTYLVPAVTHLGRLVAR